MSEVSRLASPTAPLPLSSDELGLMRADLFARTCLRFPSYRAFRAWVGHPVSSTPSPSPPTSRGSIRRSFRIKQGLATNSSVKNETGGGLVSYNTGVEEKSVRKCVHEDRSAIQRDTKCRCGGRRDSYRPHRLTCNSHYFTEVSNLYSTSPLYLFVFFPMFIMMFVWFPSNRCRIFYV